MQLHFWFDVVCPYAYLGFAAVRALERETGLEVLYHPVLLGGLFRHFQAPDQPASNMSPPRARINAIDLLRRAEQLGVDLSWHPQHPVRSVDAMRLLVMAPSDRLPGLAESLYRAYWQQHEDVSDHAVLVRVAREHGIDPAVIRSPQAKERLFQVTAQAAERGVFALPHFAVGDELFWGVDRMLFVRRALGLAPQTPARWTRSTAAKLTFYYDFSSPFSYLASTQIARIAERAGAEIEWVPILLGALFKQVGTPDVPMLAMYPAKQAYAARDMLRWAEHWAVDFQFPSTFPLRTVSPLRVALQDPSTTPHLYRAAWAHDLNIGDPATLISVLDGAGFDGERLVRGTQQPQIKAQLRHNTERAILAGACGVPTMVIDDQLLFWGQDRLDQVEAALNGWRPASESSPRPL